VVIALAAAAFGAGWLAKTTAQQVPSPPPITYFGHEKVQASFAKALASKGGRTLYSREDTQGRTFTVNTNSRGQKEKGELQAYAEAVAKLNTLLLRLGDAAAGEPRSYHATQEQVTFQRGKCESLLKALATHVRHHECNAQAARSGS
jgi:hypothetical protein